MAFDIPANCRKMRPMKGGTRKSPLKPVTERLEARVPQPLKSLIDRAAALEGRSLTDYVIATLERHAVKVVREHEILQLSTIDSEAFARAMITPPKPNRALKGILSRHAKSVTIQ
jgi:uncharacterized protein (DUF1778 family)